MNHTVGVDIKFYTTCMGEELATVEIRYSKLNINHMFYRLSKLEDRLFINIKNHTVFINLSKHVVEGIEFKTFLAWILKNLK